MGAGKVVVKNSIALLFAEVISRLLSFLLIIGIARKLGDEGLGIFSFGVATAGIFIAISDLGMQTYMLREIATRKPGAVKLFQNVLSLKWIFSIFAFGGSLLAAWFIKHDPYILLVVAVISFYLFVNELNTPFRILFNAYEKLEFYSFIITVERVLATSIGLILLLGDAPLHIFLFAFVFSYIVSLIMYVFFSRKYFSKFKIRFDISLWKKVLKKSWMFWATLIFMTIYYRIDTIMLSFFTLPNNLSNFETVGWYNAAYRIVDSFNFIPYIMIGVLFPAMAKFSKSSPKKLDLIYRKGIYYSMALGLPLAVGTFFVSGQTIIVLFSEEFIPAASTLNILIWAQFLVFLNYVTGYLLNSINKQKLFTLSAGIAAVINIILNIILIPIYGIIGAASATVATQGLNFLFLNYYANKNGYSVQFLQFLIRPLIATGIMGGILYYLIGTHIYFSVPIAGATYLVVFLLLGGLQKDDWKTLKDGIQEFLRITKQIIKLP